MVGIHYFDIDAPADECYRTCISTHMHAIAFDPAEDPRYVFVGYPASVIQYGDSL